ncbi:MAG: hypothetical protein JWR80_9212, partial [Bradyrhizobium sp.]|nr:hypothetical protein [Bradyrhizobium sp.]
CGAVPDAWLNSKEKLLNRLWLAVAVMVCP